MDRSRNAYNERQDELTNIRAENTRTSSSKKLAYGRRQRQRALSSPGKGNTSMSSPWPNNAMYSFQGSHSYHSAQGSMDQVEEMEVDHLQDAVQARKDTGQAPQRVDTSPSIQNTKVVPRSDCDSKHTEAHEKKQPLESKSSTPGKETPLFIILHANKIIYKGQTYTAISPVKISTETMSFSTEEKTTLKSMRFRISCAKIRKVQTQFDYSPYSISMTVVDALGDSLANEKSRTMFRNSSEPPNEEIITFNLAYHKDVPKNLKDELHELFHKRLGVMQNSEIPGLAESNSKPASSSSSPLKSDSETLQSPNSLKSLPTNVADASCSPDSKSRGENIIRKRATGRSISMIEHQNLDLDASNILDNKIARRCLSTDFEESTSRVKSLEVEAAEYQLLAAQRRLRIHTLEEQVALKSREIEELRRNVLESSSSLTNMLESERTHCSLIERQRDEHRTHAENLRIEIRRLENELSSQRSVASVKEQAILVRDEQLQQLRAQLNESLSADQGKNTCKCDEFRTELEESKRDAENARREAEESCSREGAAVERLTSMTERLKVVDQRLSEEVENSSRLQSELHHMEDMENMIRALQRDLANEEEKHQNTNDALVTAQLSVDDLRQNLETSQRSLQESVYEKDTLVQEKEDISREFELTQQRLQQCELNLRLAQIALDESRRTEPRDWVIDRNEIHLTDRNLGVGAWGCVKVGKFRGTEVAVKQIHQLILSPHNRRLFEREMTIAARCRHPCLLQFIGATCDDGSPLFLAEILETDLRKLLTRQGLDFSDIVSLSLDITRALAYLHGSKPSPIIHRDISSSNILLWYDRNRWRGKLSDYGAANFMRLSMSCNPGACLYSAPEAGTSEQTPKLDIFSFGVLLCETCIRELPIPSHREEQIIRITSSRCKDLVTQCVQENPTDRPDAHFLIDIFLQWKNSTQS